MKAILETVTGIRMNYDIDISDSPMTVLKKFYEADATSASQIFADERSVSQLMSGNIDEERSAFELMGIEGTYRAQWKTPLCEQAVIKEQLSLIEAAGQIPTFVVGVSSIVAAK